MATWLTALVLLGACTDETSDGAIVVQGAVSRDGVPFLITGSDCTPIRLGKSHDVIGRASYDYFALHNVSSQGTFHSEVYLRPDDLSQTVELDENNGELAVEYDLDRTSFDGTDRIEDQLDTVTGEVVDIVHVFVEDCRDLLDTDSRAGQTSGRAD